MTEPPVDRDQIILAQSNQHNISQVGNIKQSTGHVFACDRHAFELSSDASIIIFMARTVVLYFLVAGRHRHYSHADLFSRQPPPQVVNLRCAGGCRENNVRASGSGTCGRLSYYFMSTTIVLSGSRTSSTLFTCGFVFTTTPCSGTCRGFPNQVAGNLLPGTSAGSRPAGTWFQNLRSSSTKTIRL